MRVAPLGSDLLQETTNGLARGYLRFLIDKIVVGDSTVSVWAKNPAALQTMATGTFDAALPRMGKFADTYLSGSASRAIREHSPGEQPGQIRRLAPSQKAVRIANAAG